MTPDELKHFEDILIKAVQAGKQETSGLVEMIMHKLETKIEESINNNINDKIKNIDDKIDAYIKSDLEWKESVTPSIETMKELRSFGRVSGYIGRAVLLLGAVASAIYAGYKSIVK